MAFHSHKQGIVIQPGCLCLTKRLKLRACFCSGEGLSQQGQAELIQPAIIGLRRIISPVQIQLLRRQQILCFQLIQIDKIGVARKSRRGLVGAVSVSRGGNGQQLPIGLLCADKKIYKLPGSLPKIADSVGRRQRGNMQ